jgi:hypothetical protein
MSGYAVAHLDEIDEMDDGREPWRPVRHHLGITAFGVNAWTAHDAGDRIINEHDETDDANEELYFVMRGRAVFELDGERVDAPAGTLVFVRPGVTRTAFAEEPETTIIALGGVPERRTSPTAGSSGPRSGRSTRRASTPRWLSADASWPRLTHSTPTSSTTSPAARALRAGRLTRSTTSGARSTCRSGFARTQRTIRTSIRSATSPRSRNSSAAKA